MRYQPKSRIKKIREQSRINPSIYKAVERDAIRWNCSKSWIVATALAAFYDIDIIQPYEIKKEKKRKVA